MSKKSVRSDAYYKKLVKEQTRNRKQVTVKEDWSDEIRQFKAEIAAIETTLPPFLPQPKEKRQKPKTFALYLRGRQTLAEQKFWRRVRNYALGVAVQPQTAFGNYVVDFWIRDWRLVVELDGGSHLGKEAYDTRRQRWIENAFGVSFLRFDNRTVHDDLDGVIATVNDFGKIYMQEHHEPPRHARRRRSLA